MALLSQELQYASWRFLDELQAVCVVRELDVRELDLLLTVLEEKDLVRVS